MKKRVPLYVDIDSVGTKWANPYEWNSIGWRVRYGEATDADLDFAVECMADYAALVKMPDKDRRKIIRELRRWKPL